MLFSWKTTSHKDHLEVCLLNSRLLSGLIGMWSSMKITLLATKLAFLKQSLKKPLIFHIFYYKFNVQGSLDLPSMDPLELIYSTQSTLIVDFIKLLPGFQNLSPHDQFILLKYSASECRMIR